MSRLTEIWRRMGMLVRRRKFERELEEEMRLHRELKEKELIAGGVEEQEARYTANRQFGNAMNLRERGREAWGWQWLEDFVQDLRFGLRMLRQNPGFTIIAVATLALGIGVNTAIFTLAHAVLLRSLPVAKPEQLFNFGANDDCCVMRGMQDNFTLFSVPLYEHLRDHSPEFEDVAAFPAFPANLGVRRAGIGKIAEPYLGEMVSGNYFEMFGVTPYAGRLIAKEDDSVNAAPVAAISHRAWVQHFAADPSVIGGTFIVNGVPMTVVGVTPPEFYGDTLQGDPPDFWIPLGQEPALRGEDSIYRRHELYWLYVIGRLRPSTARQQASALLTVRLKQWLGEQPYWNEQDRKDINRAQILLTTARGGVANVRAQYADGLRLLMIVSGLVLLIACANIANMLLARGTAERLQTTVRAALGASHLRLMRQTITESMLLAVVGGAAGIAVAFGATRLILALAFRGSRFVPIDPAPSGPVLAFAFLLCVLTGAIFGAAPAWINARANPADALRGAGRATEEGSSLPRRSLVVLQAAMVLNVVSLGEQVRQNFNQERLIARLTGLFGLVALALACGGLYGVTAYGVARRRSEIGIRMALGAGRGKVVKMVVKGAMAQIGIGLLMGIPIALAGGRALAHQLFGVKSYDPMVLSAAVLTLAFSALLAGLVPAIRAASIDPMEALRME